MCCAFVLSRTKPWLWIRCLGRLRMPLGTCHQEPLEERRPLTPRRRPHIRKRHCRHGRRPMLHLVIRHKKAGGSHSQFWGVFPCTMHCCRPGLFHDHELSDSVARTLCCAVAQHTKPHVVKSDWVLCTSNLMAISALRGHRLTNKQIYG